MTFKELKFDDISKTHGEGAKQAHVEFENGYDIYVSHGGEKGLYEIGVFLYGKTVDPANWDDPRLMRFPSPFWGMPAQSLTDDTVKGWLNESDVEHWLNYVKGL